MPQKRSLAHWMILTMMIIPFLAMTASANAADAPAPASALDVPKIHGVHVGSTLADWGDQGLKLTVLAGSTPVLKPYKDFGATARLGWSDEGLLAQIHVVDITPSESKNIDQLYDGDSVELILGTGDPRAGIIQLIASPGRGVGASEPRHKLFDYRSLALKQTSPASGEAFFQKTADGYIVDLFLPWSNIQITPTVGSIVGARIGINDGEVGKDRTSLVLAQAGQHYNFADPPRIRLAEAAGSEPEAVAWGGYDEAWRAQVHVVAANALAGHTVEVLEAGQKRGEAKLGKDGERVSATISFPAPPPGLKNGDFVVNLDGREIDTLKLPDVDGLRQGLFRQGASDGARWGRAPQWVIPHFKQPVFDSATFPSFGYDHHDKIEQLVGRTTIKIDYYDAAYNKVTSADKPGRYGAVAVVTGETGASFTAYRTLFRRPSGGVEASGGNAVTLAAQFEGKSSGDAPKADTDWWHGLRKTLGTAVKYDYFVRTPPGYDTDKTKKWPIIYFLHGSGGGDGQNMSGIVNGGIQIAAQKDPNFPFIAVSLRSPGGWSPPAVKDVMDEVDAQYRTDQDRQYLTGFSMGGMGTWSVAFDQPDRFAAISPVGGRQGQPDKAAFLKGVGVWVFNGAVDTTTTPADAKIAVSALQAAGVEVKYTEIPAAGHVDSLDYVFHGTELFDWFLQHHRTPKP